MKKITIFLLSLLMSCSVFAESAPVSADEQNENEAIYISDHIKLIPKSQHVEDKELYYVIDVHTPVLSGENISKSAKRFNQLAQDIVLQEVERFKKYVKLDVSHMQTLPVEDRHNSLRIDYDVDFVKPGNQGIISVRVSVEGFQAGRPHPYHTNRALNFDLAKGRVLALSELFKPKANYLKILSHYSNKKLKEKLQDKWMIDAGTKPLAKNFKNWNIDPDGIIITFDEYQVAGEVQEVTIPHQALKSILSSKMPVAMG